MAEDTKNIVVTPEFRMVFPTLFEPKAFKEGAQAKYSLVMLFDAASDTTELIEAFKRTAAQRWPNRNFREDIQYNRFIWPFKTGEQMISNAVKKGKKAENLTYYEGTVVLKGDTTFPPGVVGPSKQEIVNPKDVYGGCYGFAELNIVAYDGVGATGADGVKAYLNHVMKSRDGEKLAGRSAADAFGGIAGQQSAADPTAGMPPTGF